MCPANMYRLRKCLLIQVITINTGSYMSICVSLNLLDNLRKSDKKSDKMLSLLSTSLIFCNKILNQLSAGIFKSHFWGLENANNVPYT